MLSTLLALGCDSATGPDGPPRPQTLVLFATPKIISDFQNPNADVAAFLDHYRPLASRAAETIVIFAVGNSDHVLIYRGAGYWSDSADWAKLTDGQVVDNRTMTYQDIDRIVRAFKLEAAAANLPLKVFDQVDPGVEFADNPFKWARHTECMAWEFESFDIRARMQADTHRYATAVDGIEADTQCGTFLVDQAAAYMADLGFDGILYGNQFGTRGRWLPDYGPGYSAAEADAIREFFAYSKEQYGDRQLLWFDSYNNTDVERATWSMPQEAYGDMDYILAAGFCVITFTERYRDNLASKLSIANRPPVLATLDYVDPWYTYNSMSLFPSESAQLEEIAIANRSRIDGVVFFANDEQGRPVPRALIESFAARFYR